MLAACFFVLALMFVSGCGSANVSFDGKEHPAGGGLGDGNPGGKAGWGGVDGLAVLVGMEWARVEGIPEDTGRH